MGNTTRLLPNYIKHNFIRILCYVAFLICGITDAIFGLQSLFAPVGDALVGPYIVTLLIVSLAGPVGILISLFQKDLFLIVLAVLTSMLIVIAWIRPPDTILLTAFEVMYPLVTIIGSLISWYGHYARHTMNR